MARYNFKTINAAQVEGSLGYTRAETPCGLVQQLAASRNRFDDVEVNHLDPAQLRLRGDLHVRRADQVRVVGVAQCAQEVSIPMFDFPRLDQMMVTSVRAKGVIRTKKKHPAITERGQGS